MMLAYMFFFLLTVSIRGAALRFHSESSYGGIASNVVQNHHAPIQIQAGALQTQSTDDLDTEAEAWSFSTLVDVLYSDDRARLRAARKSITSLCEANDFHNDFDSNDCDTARRLRIDNSGYRDFVFALVAHAQSNESFDAFTQSYDAIRHFHPHNSVIVVDNASPPTLGARILDFLHNDPNTVYVREETSGFEIGGYRRALKVARSRHWAVRGWVFLQATAILLQPLPLESLNCSMNPFFHIGVDRPPCGLPEFNRAEYEAFRQDFGRNEDAGIPALEFAEMGMQEFRRLKYEFPLWSQYEKLVCAEFSRPPIASAMHNMFIATAEGTSLLEDLGFFSIRLEKKIHSNFMEGFNGIFLAALRSLAKMCFIDHDRVNHVLGGGRGSEPGTVIHKQHGDPDGNGQGFFARFLSFISTVDANRDTLVDAMEIADAKANRPALFGPALRNLCDTMASEDPFQKAMGCMS
jgi:hypothetical protein